MYVQVLVRRPPWLWVEGGFGSGSRPVISQTPKAGLAPLGNRGSQGRDAGGTRLGPEAKSWRIQVSGSSSGSSLTLVQSAPPAQKQGKKKKKKKGRKGDKESTLLASGNLSRNCFNIFTKSVLKEMCNNITVTDTQAL